MTSLASSSLASNDTVSGSTKLTGAFGSENLGQQEAKLIPTTILQLLQHCNVGIMGQNRTEVDVMDEIFMS